MILTVTPNPALDYTIRLDAFEIGRRAKYRDPRIEPAGKGINVSRMVSRLGEPTFALGLAAGESGELLRRTLQEEGVPNRMVEASGLTRINITLLTGPEGRATHLHGPGAAVSKDDVDRFTSELSNHILRATIVVLSGSLPPGMDPEVLLTFIGTARMLGVRTIVDVEGPLLAAAIHAGADVVKPNALEIGELLGRPVAGVKESVVAAGDLIARGAKTVVVTMRGEGAVAVSEGKAWHVRAPREDVVRAIGAGDSFAAGLAVGLLRGSPFPDSLRLAAASGTATALHSGTDLGTPEEVARLLERTEVRELNA